MSKALIFTATYNEKDNIKILIERLNKLNVNIDILVIDDNSPDKTWQILQEIEKNRKHGSSKIPKIEIFRTLKNLFFLYLKK